MNYENFKDPFGLIKRMLLSRNKIAYFILLREFVALLLIPLDLVLLPFERRALRRAQERSDPIILVLGGSRSGTTLLYQTLAKYLPVSYINNFYSAFRWSPVTSYRLFHKLIPGSPKSFKNYYGSVSGFSGPNDAFSIWNRWFGADRNRIVEEIGEAEKESMRRFFNAWHTATQTPFLNKNNRNSLCAPLLDSIFKNIFFIEIHREPVYVAQSIIFSRKEVQGSERRGWGLLSSDSIEDGEPLAYIKDICRQVYEVDKRLAEGRSKIGPSNYLRISYESFCQNPAAVVEDVAKRALGQELNSEILRNLQFSKGSNRQRLDDDQFDEIRYQISSLYGNIDSNSAKKKDDKAHTKPISPNIAKQEN